MYFYASDHLGSSSVLTNQAGGYHERIEYLPYGEIWFEDASTKGGYSTPYKFTGKELDKETGWYYFGARYYEPRTAVWVSVDPALGEYLAKTKGVSVFRHATLSIYTYSESNPIKYIDPDGEKIVVAGDYQYRAAVQSHLASISPAARINMKTGEVYLAKGISSGHYSQGTKLLNSLIKNSHVVTIKYDAWVLRGGNRTGAYDASGAQTPKVGSDVVVYYDPKNVTSVPTLADENIVDSKAHPVIQLAHELIHAQHMVDGELNMKPIGSYKNLLGKNVDATWVTSKGGVPKEELRTVGIPGYYKKGDITENVIRKEQGVKQRGEY